MPIGGHVHPNAKAFGCILEWKNDQKKEKKKKNSDTINSTIPERKPCCTFKVWNPSKVDSLMMSMNHLLQNINNSKKPKCIFKLLYLKLCKYNTKLKVVCNSENDTKKGHGLGSTKWKGCLSFLIIFCKNIMCKLIQFRL